MSAGLYDSKLVVDSDLSKLAPKFRTAVEAALTECANRGLDALVYEAYRSQALQARYYARGRTQIPPSQPVTNAPSNLLSWHGYGLAVDVISKAQGWNAGEPWFTQVAAVFKDAGCAWGGDWTQRDQPHFQWGLCKPSPSPLAREIVASQGVRGVWIAVGADDADNADVIARLALNPYARQAATILAARFPNVTFTSGRRSVKEQTAAMAGNIVLDRNYVRGTYKQTAISLTCQKWVDDNPAITNTSVVAAKLLEIFNSFPPAQVALFSRHLSGDAFDVEPVPIGGEPIMAFMQKLPNLDLFLSKEGSLDRWHAQFLSSG